MEARLVRVVGQRRSESVPLERDEFVLGRDPSCDLVLEYARVSRRHAAVRRMGERHTIADLGSTNGTTVNGRPAADPVLLQHGDVIDLAGEVALLYESEGAVPSARPWVALAAAMLVVLVAASGLLLWRCAGGRSADLERAFELARRGHEAAQKGDAPAAKAQLKQAAGLLYHSGELDDVPRAETLKVAMERLGEPLGPDVDLWAELQNAMQLSAPKLKRASSSGQPGGCRLDRVTARELEPCLRERIELVMIELRQDPVGMPDDFHRTVGRRILRERELIERSLARGSKYVPMIRRELEKGNMPPLLHYLALIESGYDPGAVSPSKAVGLWQFMPGTARNYKLAIDGPRDERRDPRKSTEAAVRYLRDLAFEFGGDALLLALAGYNRGENGVRRALKQMDDPFSDRSYWRLVEKGLLPQETAEYVPRFVAAAVAGEGGLPRSAVLIEAGY
jgi:soluble lytic murein transglycosylase-like protein